jgi:hypothetical protein
MSMHGQLWGWAGSVEQFLETPLDQWLDSLSAHTRALIGGSPSSQQVTAWRDEHDVLRVALRDVCVAEPAATGWGLVFEYELPLEGGRRPDVVVLTGHAMAVLEFKQDPRVTPAAIDQVKAYARDLMEYHAASHGVRANPVLVLTRASDPPSDDEVQIVDPTSLAAAVLRSARPGHIALDEWLHARYEPLPMLVAAARRIFQHEPLPVIKSALATSIPQAVELLGQLAEEAGRDRHRVLAFIAGVPGSGKTLAGLSLVYERVSRMSAATFLSGNGPLVEVLRDALKSRVFVNDLHAFIKTYGTSTRIPNEHVIVFDEAQRAWDADYMKYKNGIHRSEPDLLVDVGERLPEWAMLVGLVGDGQEIHVGEEAGIDQWHDAVRPSRGRQQWRVHCPPRLRSAFTEVAAQEHEVLDLTVSLRSRRADHLHDWVVALLDGRLGDAARLATRIHAAAYPMYVTRDIDAARRYVWDLYGNNVEKRYGLLASSRNTNLPKHGVDSSFPATKKIKLARWFNESRGHPQSCCELRDVITEFQCQGLELDLPVVCWGNDLTWTGRAWDYRPVRSQYPMHDQAAIRRNAYRVLLTRGRDGMVVFVPPERAMDQTEHALLAAGVRPLEMPVAAARQA